MQKLFRGTDGELSIIGRLAAGACAGMTSTLVRLKPFFFILKFLYFQTVSYLL